MQLKVYIWLIINVLVVVNGDINNMKNRKGNNYGKENILL
jgi:hypothetical protein